MNTIYSRLFVVPFLLLAFTLSGCGDPQTASTDPAAVEAIQADPDVKTTFSQVSVNGPTKLVVPRSGKLTYTTPMNGFFNGALGSLKIVQGKGVDIPTTPCTGTRRQVIECQLKRAIAFIQNPTSVEVLVNNQVVIAKGSIPRTQGSATVAIAVNAANTLTINLTGLPGSYITEQVTSENTQPLQNPTADFSFNPTTGGIPLSVVFDGSASSSPNGSITNYSWDFGDGNSASGNFEVNHIYRAAGTFAIVLTVTDSAGMTATAAKQIVVTPPQPPIASFTYSVDTSTGSITLSADGSSSSSPNGSILDWSWDFGDGGTGSGGAVTYIFAFSGTYEVSLTVTDNVGYSDTTYQTITVP